MGLTIRSLGASYNQLAQKRRDAVIKAQAQSVQDALATIRPGFSSFFNSCTTDSVGKATQAQTLEMLLNSFKGNSSRSYSSKKSGNRDYRRKDNYDRQRYARDNQRNQNRKQNSTVKYTSKPSPKKEDNYKQNTNNRRQGRGGSLALADRTGWPGLTELDTHLRTLTT